MSIYLACDESSPTELCSNKGWSDFLKWVDGLDVDEASELMHLCDYGWTQKPEAVRDQLSDMAPAESVKGIADELAVLLKGVEIAVVTNGVTNGDSGFTASSQAKSLIQCPQCGGGTRRTDSGVLVCKNVPCDWSGKG